jgi:tetratricopeptide (TPR) repeat protein
MTEMKQILILFLCLSLLISCDFSSAEDYLHQAERVAENGKYEEAIKLTNKAINKNNKLVEAYIDRALFYSKLGNDKKSLLDLKKVITIDSKNTLALYNITLIYSKIENYPMVLYFSNKTFETKDGGIGCYVDRNNNAFGNSEKIDVPSHLIYFERAKANYNLSKLEDARYDFLMCIDDNYKNSECYYWIGTIYLKAGNSKLARENFNLARLLGNKDAENIIEKL